MASRLRAVSLAIAAFLWAAPSYPACQFNSAGDISNPNDPSCRDVQLRYTRSDDSGNNIALGYDVPFPVESLTGVDGFRSYQSLFEQHQSLDAESSLVSSEIVGQTISGRDIWAYRVGDPDDDQPDGSPEGVALVNGTIHAREWQSPEVVTELFEQLTETATDGGFGQYLSDNLDVVIVPVLNVDGFLQTQRYPDRMTADEQQPRDGRMRRKNVRHPTTGTAIDEDIDQTEDNFFGVDLNRNNPDGFGQNGSSSSNPISLVYRAGAPQSEPEIQALLVAAELAPATRLRMYSDVHSFSQIFFTPLTGDAVRDRITRDLVTRMRRVSGGKYRYGPDSSSGIGLTSDYFARSLRIPSWTLETEPLRGGIDYGGTDHGHSGFVLPASEVARMRDEVAAMLLAGLYAQADKPRLIAIRVRDAATEEVRFEAEWQGTGSGRSLKVIANQALVPGGRYRLWLGFNKPMRWRDSRGEIANYPGQSVPAFAAIRLQFPALPVEHDVTISGDADAWRAQPGEDGFFRYRDDALITEFTVPASLPAEGPIAGVFSISARDMTDYGLDADPSSEVDWQGGRWTGYENTVGANSETGGTDCNFVAFVAADPGATPPAGDETCRIAASPPPVPPPPPGDPGTGGGGGGAIFWMLPPMILIALCRLRRKWRR
ncbi:MAG: hypothetical protein JSW21_09550 [Gammaproteobacteria bacterium]|nr:MAG: hypothetical protein JSW21_09550 [Gammaproteobacteria bacterium]